MKQLRLRCLELAWDMKKGVYPTSIKDIYDLAESIYQWTMLTTERIVKWEDVEGLIDKFEKEYQKALKEKSIAENTNSFQKRLQEMQKKQQDILEKTKE